MVKLKKYISVLAEKVLSGITQVVIQNVTQFWSIVILVRAKGGLPGMKSKIGAGGSRFPMRYLKIPLSLLNESKLGAGPS